MSKFVGEIDGYYSHTGDFWPVEEGYGNWLEDGPDGSARYATGPEESEWIVFDDEGRPWLDEDV